MAYRRGELPTDNKEKKPELLGLAHSSFLQQAAFDSKNNTLTLDFRNGLQEIHTDFSATAWQQFKESSSQGSFYARQIKGKYSKVDVRQQLKVSDFTKAMKKYTMRPPKRRVKGR